MLLIVGMGIGIVGKALGIPTDLLGVTWIGDMWALGGIWSGCACNRHLLIPLGIIAIGIPLVFIGAIMAAGNGTADIVAVMQNLGFPVWGFIVLWLASWTSQLTYVVKVGIPPLQSLLITGIVYYAAMKIKAKTAPDKFTEGMFE
ncbi:MAG: hypothetical protein U0I51_11685, partial [Muricomes sp.]|nr:hypothetical protein [Muricomes sp.]